MRARTRANHGSRSISVKGSPRDIFSRASGLCRSSASTNTASRSVSGAASFRRSTNARPSVVFPHPATPYNTYARDVDASDAIAARHALCVEKDWRNVVQRFRSEGGGAKKTSACVRQHEGSLSFAFTRYRYLRD
jgi:hypothetical protein